VSQPAIYVASLAAVEKLKARARSSLAQRACSLRTLLSRPLTLPPLAHQTTEEGRAALAACNVAAGLSLGEYTALAFAGALSFEDGLRLVQLRGQSMQAAADAAPSAMASVIGLSSEQVAALCEKASEQAGAAHGVRIANFLCPGNYAVSGGVPGIEVLEKIAKPEFKARMTVRLAVAGAFHTDYMAPAVPRLAEALAATALAKPRIPVVSNVDAKPHSDPAVIKAILAKQVTSPVQWEATLNTLLAKGLNESFELGPGKVIAGIMKRISKEAKLTNVEA
jgi:[acyl-carrier-protein] S-malonyltransferase